MPILNWKPSYELGFKVIDEQHHHLVDMLNKLFDSYNDDAESEALESILNELEDYAKEHFATEEKYFKEFGFEGAEAHIVAHRGFEKSVKKLKEEFAQKGVSVIEKVTELIGRWFLDHEEKFDKGYVECFKGHGLT